MEYGSRAAGAVPTANVDFSLSRIQAAAITQTLDASNSNLLKAAGIDLKKLAAAGAGSVLGPAPGPDTVTTPQAPPAAPVSTPPAPTTTVAPGQTSTPNEDYLQRLVDALNSNPANNPAPGISTGTPTVINSGSTDSGISANLIGTIAIFGGLGLLFWFVLKGKKK